VPLFFLFQQILVQYSVMLVPSVMRLLAARIRLYRLVPQIKILSVQLIVVPRSVNTGTSLGKSWMAFFEGALTAQVKETNFFKEPTKCFKTLVSIFQFRDM